MKLGVLKIKCILKKTFLERAELFRLKEDGISYDLIYFNLEEVLNGFGLANEFLKMGDKVNIYSNEDVLGRQKKIVTASGYVKNPGNYDLTSNMRISDLLFSAGGMDDPEFKSMMYLKRVDLVRLQKDGNQKEIRSLSLKSILADSKSSDNLFLQDGDLVRVYNVQTFKEIKPVFIRGVVKNPGEYEIKYNMNIKDLIIEAGGIPSNYNYFKIELSRRQNNDLNSVKNYKITDYYFNNDLEEIYSFDKASGLLKPYDIVSVYIENGRNDELNNSITINGSVKFEGDYIVINDEERITDVLKRAGGLLNSANPNASQFIRNDKLIFFDLDWIIKYPNSKKIL